MINLNRLLSKVNPFWKAVQMRAIMASVAAGGLLAANQAAQSTYGFSFPEYYTIAAQHIIEIGAAVAFLAQLTKPNE